MSDRIKNVFSTLGSRVSHWTGQLGGAAGRVAGRRSVIALAVAGLGAYGLVTHPPLQAVEPGEVAVRVNQLSGGSEEFRDGAALVLPGLHSLRRYSVRDQVFHIAGEVGAGDTAPFQSIEGLSLGIDMSVRYALDGERIGRIARALPENVGPELVEPVIRSAVYKTLARYTVREIFSSKRAEIQQLIEDELRPLLAADGIRLGAVMMGQVSLPKDYQIGMERLLAEELATEKMRYTLELKEKQVRQSELEADADKARRERAAEAAGQEQIIAAKAQAEAMKHVLPFKQKQIEQRGLEAEAEKITRIKAAEANAQARQIEAAGEAESRRKLADAEGYRQEKLGQIASAQLARDGALIQKNPLLIQKTLADKLSDKISVIIAPPPSDGGFIGATLLGKSSAAPAPAPVVANENEGE